MKITIAQLNYHIGNFKGNLEKMEAAIDQAKVEKADIICFSELATCGYPPRDFLEFEDFVSQSNSVIEALCALSKDIAIVVGAPSRNPDLKGKELFNSAYFLAGGEILHVQHKCLLPTYDIFDEYRYFEPAHTFEMLEYKGKKIALSVCEDIWDIPEFKDDEGFNPMYNIVPLDQMGAEKADFIINVSASPFTYNKAQARKQIVKANCLRYGIPMFYVNHVGAQTDVIFDGGSLVIDGKGELISELAYFNECIQTFDLLDSNQIVGNQELVEIALSEMDKIHDALVMGVRDYFKKLRFKRAIIGLSGGIDSALTAVIAQRALGAENVRVVLMPSQFSSDHSVNDARELAENLEVKYDIIPIKGVYDSFMNELLPLFEDLPFNVTEENLQARSRGVLLMALSNKFGNILLNTSNKSEAAVGYGTLYGDMCGGLSVIGDLYKTQVFELCKHINKDEEIIPWNTINKPPSAELRPNQKDSDSLPDYDILDKILFEYIENRLGPKEIVKLGFDDKLVKRILRLVNINEFKRYQTAPTLRVSSKAFGMGRRMPIVGKYLS